MPFKLTDAAIRAAKPKEKPYKLTDCEGLYIRIRGIYNRAECLPERRRMMDEWAVYLDTLRAAA